MEIVKYPHPTLRYRSKPLKRIDSALREIVSEMFQLMYEAQGIGLAANQVNLPYRLFVLNVHEERLKDYEMVFINPVISRPRDPDQKEEGCLSLPGVYAQVRRPASIHVTALNLAGEPIEGEFSGLLARAIQHETDHLDGILFIDRLVDLTKKQLQDDLDRFQKKYDLDRSESTIPSDEIIFKRLAEMEATYCV
ncbi:MAG: peptide deformylase [Planctomycetota bacterium]|nr:peptide deformylase [Planctomycetota bacterium]